MKTLVIGYGNNSRRDDGIGWFVIEQLGARALPDVELRTGHQLEVELAEDLGAYDCVIFVDAAIPQAPAAVQCSELTPRFESHAVAHYLTPPDVLSLAATLYGHRPRAFLFSIRGQDFNFGTTFTPAVEAAGHQVVDQITGMLTERLAGVAG